MENVAAKFSIIGILRGIEGDFFSKLMHVAFREGLEAIEVTMNTPGALSMVRHCRKGVPEGKLLGMGTIRNIDEAKMAVDAGAMFLVTPNCDKEVISYSISKNIPVISGALSPTEVYAAWSSGASMIKVFPCQAMGGPRYIRDLRGPFDHIPLVAVGGVSRENVGEYFNAGAKGVGVSSALFGRKALAQQNIDELAENVKKFMQYCQPARAELD
ncbi:MAG: bifunctional 4-hydroxy-2-oxoglutarate aldolase/2-dehydro-3-deoxy-phosphogluconate aldolase [Desulfobulbaceae bacterium]|nr:bifunctional 4-hydroxy-2-oxoglutarate aldolase/2-dehydro-3-deoxy-phosphogluconate aldolase [Desulfobulbaceae bacterium]